MICPHCRNTTEEQDEYPTSAPVANDDPALIRRRRLVMLYMAVFIVAAFAFAELAKVMH